MIQWIRKSRITKVVASYLAIQLIVQLMQPVQLWALTGGPSQPEFNSFTPIGTSDMVDLSSGDFNYNIPIMDVGGYPLNLAYNSGVTLDQEASWVGLGWNLNVGQIARQVRGIPDDFKGDEIRYENGMKTNKTFGATFGVNSYVFGKKELGPNIGLGIQYNNYNGISFMPTIGMSFNMHDNVSLGFNISGSDTDGANISPSLSLHPKKEDAEKRDINLSSSFGVSYNSRQGISSMNLSLTTSRVNKSPEKNQRQNDRGSFGGFRSFVNNTYTPTKRTAYSNHNASISAAIGSEFMGPEVQGDITGYASFQKIRKEEKDKYEKAFGYEYTDLASNQDILDFNREKDRSLNEASAILPLANYTYDLYAIQGQGIGGQFRPFRGQVGYLFDNEVVDVGGGGSFGAEFGAGNLIHAGVAADVNDSSSSSGLWVDKNNALPHFQEQNESKNPAYQKVYYKKIGEMNIDKEVTESNSLFYDDLSGYNPIRIAIKDNGGFGAKNRFEYKDNSSSTTQTKSMPRSISKPIKRKDRILTGDAIQKKMVIEVDKYGNDYEKSLLSNYVDPEKNGHHIAQIGVLQKDGSRYVFGKAAYNTKKVEATFNVSKVNTSPTDIRNGLTSYRANYHNSKQNNDGNGYFNRITTPSYAHSYLLTSVLSTDYEDVTNDGPTPDDLGAYTKFTYQNKNNYKWRIPFEENKASYNEGLKSDATDQMGSYVYGEKELWYAQTIETKTHVAKFFISEREDALGVKGENGGMDSNAKMYKLDKIELYSRPEFETAQANGTEVEPIKVAYFEYNYNLAIGSPNSEAATKGRLTLKKLYFTYRDSHMGRYTPYVFNYNETLAPFKIAQYTMKNYDIWGNYKPGSNSNGLNDPLSVSEFPYVEQNKEKADENIQLWNLKSIGLPSGGVLEIEQESDDYQYVQNRKTMRMFKVVGVGSSSEPSQSTIFNTELYSKVSPAPKNNYLYVDIEDSVNNETELQQKVIDPIIDQPIYFRFLINMRKEGALRSTPSSSASFDYVTGYFHIDDSKASKLETINNKDYAIIPIKFPEIEGGINGKPIHPVSKAGFNFGRKYLNNIVYSSVNHKGVNEDKTLDVLKKIIGSLGSILNVFEGPNQELKRLDVARRFKNDKSWVRLMNPSTEKYGGGCRVKSVKMLDNWDVMNNAKEPDGTVALNPSSLPTYKQFYGQVYEYTLPNGTSSGVATYEPLISKENPFVEPIYEGNVNKLLAPSTDNYVEKPIGESFFPSPAVTYSRVIVRNLPRELQDADGNVIRKVKKHATGYVEHQFYTSFNYPTQVDFTDLKTLRKEPRLPSNPVFVDERRAIAFSQGFVVHTNDMNGKMKSQRVYAEDAQSPISGVDYVYHERDLDTYEQNPIIGKLNNQVNVIDEKGNVIEKQIGVEFDVINDFRRSESTSSSVGANFNVATFLAAVWPAIVPFPVPKANNHSDVMKSVSTTKVIHTTGLLKEKIAFDLGSKVSTKNLAWDANTGEVLVTETVNEYKDYYYNLNYPAYWVYKGMGQASKNLGLEWELEPKGNGFALVDYTSTLNEDAYLNNGDEIQLNFGYTTDVGGGALILERAESLWIHNLSANGFQLMTREGKLLNPSNIQPVLSENGEQMPFTFRIVRSGYRNQQSASMASMTMMANPIDEAVSNGNKLPDFAANTWSDYRIVNTSAVGYSDLWETQCEANLPEFDLPEDVPYADRDSFTDVICFNPYLNNVRGDWRAEKSYAYLTNRKSSDDPELRGDGFFTDYAPIYTPPIGNGDWGINKDSQEKRWTFASAVTQYSPFGAELENRDALNRYSSAQYGYNYTLPTAVSSNSRYQSMGFDGFEDYDVNAYDRTHFGFMQANPENQYNRTTTTSHTGTASIAVNPGKKASFGTRLVPCPEVLIEANNDVVNFVNETEIKINPLYNDILGDRGLSGNSIQILNQPNNGTVELNNNETPDNLEDDYLIFYPEDNFSSSSFSYKICGNSCGIEEDGECSTAVVRLEKTNIDLELACSDGCPLNFESDYTYGVGGKVTITLSEFNDDKYDFTWSYLNSSQSVNGKEFELQPTYVPYVPDNPDDNELYKGITVRKYNDFEVIITDKSTGAIYKKEFYMNNYNFRKPIIKLIRTSHGGIIYTNIGRVYINRIFCESRLDCIYWDRGYVDAQITENGRLISNDEYQIMFGGLGAEASDRREVSNNEPFCNNGLSTNNTEGNSGYSIEILSTNIVGLRYFRSGEILPKSTCYPSTN